MKKINYLLIGIMMFITANAFCQTSYLLTFSGKDKNTSANVTLDSVNIKNVTTGVDETIIGTSYTLELTTGVTENNRQDMNAFAISQNYPNPSAGRSIFEVVLPEGGKLKITAYNLSGQEISAYSGNLNTGIHSFSFEGSEANVFMIVADNGKEKSSIKVLNTNSFANNKSKIHYIGSSKNNLNPVKKLRGTVTYTPGDTLMLTGYAAGYAHNAIYDSPTGNKLYTFEFESVGTMTDARDGHTYKIVEIGNQTWMAENIAYLPSVSPSSEGSETTPYHYVYDYQGTSVTAAKATSNYQSYGVLYNWLAAMNESGSSSSNPSGVQGVCPTGWHLPSDAEWKELEMYLGMSQSQANSSGWRGTTEGGKMKETGMSHWNSPNTGATNSSGFTALPGGYRGNGGTFDDIGYNGHWWSSTESSSTSAWPRLQHYNNSKVYRSNRDKDYGFSVRCARD